MTKGVRIIEGSTVLAQCFAELFSRHLSLLAAPSSKKHLSLAGHLLATPLVGVASLLYPAMMIQVVMVKESNAGL